MARRIGRSARRRRSSVSCYLPNLSAIIFDFNQAPVNALRVTSATNTLGVSAVFTTNASQWEPGGFENGVWLCDTNGFILHNAGTFQGSNQRYVFVQLDSPVPLRLEEVRFRSNSNASGSSPQNPIFVAVEIAARDDFADATVLGTLPTSAGPLADKYLAFDIRVPAGKTNIRVRSVSPIPDASNYINYVDFVVAASPLASRQIEPRRIAFDFDKAAANDLRVSAEANDIDPGALFTTNAAQREPGEFVNGVLSSPPHGSTFVVHNSGASQGANQRYAYLQLSGSTALHLYGLRLLSNTNAADGPVTLVVEAAEQDTFANATLLGTLSITGGGLAEQVLPLDLRVRKGPFFIRLPATSPISDGSDYIAYSEVSLAAVPVESNEIIITYPSIGGGDTMYAKYFAELSSTVHVHWLFQAWTAEPFDARRPWTGITLSTAGQYLTQSAIPLRNVGGPCLTTSPDPGQAAKLLPLPLVGSRWLLRRVDDPNLVLTFWTAGFVTEFQPLQAADGYPYFQRLAIQGEVPGQHSLKRARPMPTGMHIMSVTAAASTSVLHLIATVMEGEDNRALWHAIQNSGSTEVTWSQVAGDREFPVTEAEFVLHDDGTLSIFALDDYGWAHLRYGDAPWSEARWNAQVVPFTDLTASYENGVHAIYGLDDDGTLWRANFTSDWGGWEKIGIAIQPVFTDISSAAGYIVGTDSNGAIWVLSPQSSVWQAVQPPGGTAFTLVDMSWGVPRGKPTLWAVDSLGAVWSGEFSRDATPPAVMSLLATPSPVPITGDFCAVEQDTEARVWGISNLTELWGGHRGDPLWDGPSWGGLRLDAGMPILALAAFLNSASNRQTIAVSAVAASQPSGSAIWNGERDESAQPPDWNLWYTQPAPNSAAPIVALAAAHSSATRLWALSEAGALFYAPLTADGALAWQPVATTTVKRIAAAHVPNGDEALWVARSDGSIEQAVSAQTGFTSFVALAGILAREIAVASAPASTTRAAPSGWRWTPTPRLSISRRRRAGA